MRNDSPRRRAPEPPERNGIHSRRAAAAARASSDPRADRPCANRPRADRPRTGGPRTGDPRDDGQLPLVGRVFKAPLVAKVPEIIFLFWIVKILTTAGGEVTSDYLKNYGNFGGGGTEVVLFVAALIAQFAARRYRALAYWSLAYAIAIAGTGLADFMHLDMHIPYGGTSLLWAVILAAIFIAWHHSEGTLSIHSITSQRREAFYWATVFATFALGTALGDFTASSLSMGYLDSGIFFFAVILLPALAWWRFHLNAVAAFWMAYIVTRPLGASFSDYFSKPASLTGLNFGNGRTAIVIAAIVLVAVVYLAIVRPDIQRSSNVRLAPVAGTGAGRVGEELELEVE